MVTLLQRTAEFGTAAAIRDQSGKHTFTELDRASRRIAGGLSRTLPRPTGSRVALLLAPGFEYVATLWGIWRVGGTAVPLSPSHPLPEMDYVLGDSGTRLAVTGSRQLNLLAGSAADCQTLPVRKLLIPGQEQEADHLPPKDGPALILYTSGTTGKPKGALTSHRAILGFVQCYSLTGLEGVLLGARRLAAAGEEPPPPPPSPCTLATVPLFHLSGLYAASIMMLAVGGKTIFSEGRFDPDKVLGLMEREGVTAWTALGNTGQRIVAHLPIGVGTFQRPTHIVEVESLLASRGVVDRLVEGGEVRPTARERAIVGRRLNESVLHRRERNPVIRYRSLAQALAGASEDQAGVFSITIVVPKMRAVPILKECGIIMSHGPIPRDFAAASQGSTAFERGFPA